MCNEGGETIPTSPRGSTDSNRPEPLRTSTETDRVSQISVQDTRVSPLTKTCTNSWGYGEGVLSVGTTVG